MPDSFKIVNETEETMVRWDIEADDEVIVMVAEHGRKVATERDFFEIGLRDILVTRAEQIIKDHEAT